MKPLLTITTWLLSMLLMATDNLLQALIAMCLFAFSSYMLNKNLKEVDKARIRFEEKLKKLINR